MLQISLRLLTLGPITISHLAPFCSENIFQIISAVLHILRQFFVAIRRSILVNCTRAFENWTRCVSLMTVFTIHHHFHDVHALSTLPIFVIFGEKSIRISNHDCDSLVPSVSIISSICFCLGTLKLYCFIHMNLGLPLLIE